MAKRENKTERVYSEYRTGRNWGKKAVEYVKENMYSKSVNEMSEHLGMTKSTLNRMMARCGYTFDPNSPEDMVRWMQNRERNDYRHLIKIYDGKIIAPRKTGKKDGSYQMFIKMGWKDERNKNGDKVGKWMLLSHYEWQKAGNELEHKMVLDYRDGDWTNTHIDNLVKINRGEAIAEAMRRSGNTVGRPKGAKTKTVVGKNTQQYREDKRKVRQQQKEREQQGKTYNGRSSENRESSYKKVEKQYATKVVDRSQMMYVRIDTKTQIEVPKSASPEDIAVAKERYIAMREKRLHSVKMTGSYN